MMVLKNEKYYSHTVTYSNLYFKMYVLQIYCLAQKLENVIFNWCIIAEPGFWALVCVIINTRKERVIQNPNHKNTAIVFCTVQGIIHSCVLLHMWNISSCEKVVRNFVIMDLRTILDILYTLCILEFLLKQLYQLI